MQLLTLITAAAICASSGAAAAHTFRLKASADAPPLVAGQYLGIGVFNTDTAGASLGWNNPAYSDFVGRFVGGAIQLAAAKESQIVYLQETIREDARPKYVAKVGVPAADPNPTDTVPDHDRFVQAADGSLGYEFAGAGVLADWTACGLGRAAGDAVDQVTLYLGKSPVTDTGCYASFKLEVEVVET
ncbi:hypothetical protein EDC01DRAFT_657040 [Geopyxis carbonaria]|nr:hypothetical protein EDC01DRAFT_657040 [Geopyxis carbonaria]